jgi:GT2 family glycosyltransferase
VKNFLKKIITRIPEVWKEAGWRGPLQLVEIYRRKQKQQENYQAWIALQEKPEKLDEKEIRAEIESFSHKPLISVILPVYNVDEKWLRLCIDSVLNQLYSNWELCIADDASTAPHIPGVLKEYTEKDERIRLVMRFQNGHISEASNSALMMAGGEWTVLLDHDDELSPDALYYVAKEINEHTDAQLIYSDEDLIDTRGVRSEPKFKPGWSPDLFYSLNLVTHLSAFRTDLLRKIGGFRVGFEGSQDYDLTLRAIEQIDEKQIRHIPKILYHWRTLESSVASSSEAKPYAHERARQAIREHFERTSIAATVTEGYPPLHRVIYDLPGDTKISVIYGGGKKQFEKISAENFEFISAETGSGSLAERFNSAAQKAGGNVLVFFENDVAGLTIDALGELAALALQKNIGAAGARLLYQNGRVHQGGIILGIADSAGFAYRRLPGWYRDSLMRAQVINNFSAVSGACMATRKDIFDEIGGFDALDFPNGFYDVDYCLRLRERGYRVTWTPHVELVGDGKTVTEKIIEKRDSKEVKAFREKWKSFLENDPYYNPNLSLEREDMSLDINLG